MLVWLFEEMTEGCLREERHMEREKEGYDVIISVGDKQDASLIFVHLHSPAVHCFS
jgi:hypothetical protein